jgi:hypothetical protein
VLWTSGTEPQRVRGNYGTPNTFEVMGVPAARVLETYVWRVSTLDTLTFGAVSMILLAAGLQACAWPARRASRISPIVALKRN